MPKFAQRMYDMEGSASVIRALFGAMGILIPVLSCRAAQRYSVVERLRQE